MQIEALPTFDDNYVWLLSWQESGQAVVVDPGDAAVVQNILRARNLKLSAVLLTHAHPDHIMGVLALRQAWQNLAVFGPKETEYWHTQTVQNTAQFQHENLPGIWEILDVAGHTKHHIAWRCGEHLFSGDVLFSSGCGKVFTQDYSMAYESLQKIKKLEKNTKIYAAHEYTESNLSFALQVEPDNLDLRNYAKQVIDMRYQGLSTLPTNMETELKINPFLRCELPNIQAAIRAQGFGSVFRTSIDYFAALRQWKERTASRDLLTFFPTVQ